jgi:hypothetical protein
VVPGTETRTQARDKLQIERDLAGILRKLRLYATAAAATARNEAAQSIGSMEEAHSLGRAEGFEGAIELLKGVLS